MRLVLITTIIFLGLQVSAQDKFYTKAGKIQFDATTAKSPEKIMASTNAAICVLDTKTGNIQFSIVMKSFEFANALMQEHFNENYVESNTYPKAEFKGAIKNNTAVNYSKDGTYSAMVSGTLTFHGVTKPIETTGKLIVQNGKILVNAAFPVKVEDYSIKIPGLVSDKVAEIAKITVDCPLDPLKK